MKTSTHPSYYTDAKVTCICGNAFTTGSTVQDIRTEICSNCHPFYTGKQKLVDTARRVDRFHRILSKKSATPRSKKRAPAKKTGQ